MEKYGVTEQPEKIAELQEVETCPTCGATLIDINQTGVLLCPQCGSEPFEN